MKVAALFTLAALTWYALEAPNAFPAQQHAHKCSNCGEMWSHGANMRGNKVAHTCKCGTLNWKQHNRFAELFV